jgi:hypothetical protein
MGHSAKLRVESCLLCAAHTEPTSQAREMERHFRSRVLLIQVAASIPKVSGPILAALKEAGLPE